MALPPLVSLYNINIALFCNNDHKNILFDDRNSVPQKK